MHPQSRRGPGPAMGMNSGSGINGSTAYTGVGPSSSSTASAANMSARQKAALASAYEELGKELHASSALKTVGNYTLGRPIAEGTFGKVSLATHRLTNTRVAIKQIPKSHSSHAAAALTREIHHHRKLHHPHVTQLYEVLATESSIWMVSELCAGGELYDYLVERGTLPDAEARRLFGQLCLAVAYIHERGIVHRDLKLENVLLDEMCNVKLGDFGFTREFERRKLMDTFCGTTGYAAPEMLAGKKYFGQEVDIWSLGIILYALLTGALPFDDDDEDIMRLKILQGDYDIPEDLSDDARDLIRSILKQNPVERLGIRAILSHPWFTRHPMPPLPSLSSFGTSGAESADHNHPPSSYRHPHLSNSAPPSDGGSEVLRERESENRERERSRAASRTGGGPVSDLPPTTEADNESNNSVSHSAGDEADGDRTFRQEQATGDETEIKEKDSDEPVVGVHAAEGENAQADAVTTDVTNRSPEIVASSSSSSSLSAPVGLHQTTASTMSQLSDLSFVSAVSESESASMEESTPPRSESTSPTTEDDDEELEGGAAGSSASALAKPAGEVAPGGEDADKTKSSSSDEIDRQRLKSMRNESQTTIRRKDSMGSDQSRKASGPTSVGANASAPLPTHHESPTSSIDDPRDTTVRSNSGPSQSSVMTTTTTATAQSVASTSAPTLTGPEGSNLTKFHSQNSSRSLATAGGGGGGPAGGPGAGHFRTPSRTKRRSASSIALSVEGILPPHSASAASATRFVDYVSLLTQLQPTLFSTLVEQRLLFALSMVGVEVGQIVHSVTTDACDASGALWWILKKKAEEREREKESEAALAAGVVPGASSKDAAEVVASGVGVLGGGGAVPPSGVQRPVSPPLPPTPQTDPMSPPPIPPKDPARHRTDSDHARAAAVAALVSIGSNEGLPKSAQDSFREHLNRLPGASGTAAMAALRQLERDRSLAAVSGVSSASVVGSQSDSVLALQRAASRRSNASSEAAAATATGAARGGGGGGVSGDTIAGRTSYSAAEVPRPGALSPSVTAAQSSTSPLRQQVLPETPSHTTPSSPVSASAALATVALNITPNKGTRPKRADRPRTNSLSIRTFANALSGRSGDGSSPSNGAGGNSSGHQDGESNHPERAKSPVSALFSRRGAGSLIAKAGGGRGKEAERTPTIGVTGPGSGGVAGSSIGPRADPFQPGTPASILSKTSGVSPGSPSKSVDVSSHTPTSVGASSKAAPGLTPKKSVNSVKQGPLGASMSQDTFSTVQSQGETDETKKRSEKARRPKSSFLSTVRTWLNADERHAKKRKQKQSQAAALSLAHGFAGSPASSALRGGGTLGGSAAHSRNNSASLSGSVARNTGSVRSRQNPYPPVSPTVRRSLVGPFAVASGSNRGSMSRRSSTGSTVLPGIAASASAIPTSASAGAAGTSTNMVTNAHDGLNRPTNFRRQSAGSITPTGTAFGDYAHEMPGLFAAPLRGSRPSSMHSFSQQQLHPRRLPAKTGSVGSASSFRRPYDAGMTKSGSNSGSFNAGSFNGNSLKSIHNRRPSADGGTVVKRHKSGYGLALGVNGPHQRHHHHRTGSGHSRASSPGPSMLSEIARGEGPNEAEGGGPTAPGQIPTFTRGGGSGDVPSNRSSAYEGDLLAVPSAITDEPSEILRSASGSLNGLPSSAAHSTLFVAHKSRSPYKPPSANHALQGAIHRAAAVSQAHGQQGHGGANLTQPSSDLRSVPLCTWHRSWGRPPPGWTGPVDDSPAPPKRTSPIQRGVRDVFARRKKSGYADADDEDDWVDEEDEPAYVGGLGQLDSSKVNGLWVSSSSGLRTSHAASQGFASLPGFHPFSSTPSGLPQSSSSALHPALSSPIPGRGFGQFDGFMPRGGSSGSGSGGAAAPGSSQRGAYPSYLSRHTPSSSNNGPFSSASASGQGLRGLFAPPSLGSDVYPRQTVISESSSVPAASPAVSTANPAGAEGSGSQVAEGGGADVAAVGVGSGSASGSGSGTAGGTEAGGSTTGTGVGAVGPRRAAAAAASAFVSIEEGEEEED